VRIRQAAPAEENGKRMGDCPYIGLLKSVTQRLEMPSGGKKKPIGKVGGCRQLVRYTARGELRFDGL